MCHCAFLSLLRYASSELLHVVFRHTAVTCNAVTLLMQQGVSCSTVCFFILMLVSNTCSSVFEYYIRIMGP